MSAPPSPMELPPAVLTRIYQTLGLAQGLQSAAREHIDRDETAHVDLPSRVEFLLAMLYVQLEGRP